GKVAPKSKSELTPEEKLLHAIFGKAGVDVKNASLTMPPGTRGVVIDAQKFSRRVNLTDAERSKALAVIRDAERDFLRSLRGSCSRLHLADAARRARRARRRGRRRPARQAGRDRRHGDLRRAAPRAPLVSRGGRELDERRQARQGARGDQRVPGPHRQQGDRE